MCCNLIFKICLVYDWWGVDATNVWVGDLGRSEDIDVELDLTACWFAVKEWYTCFVDIGRDLSFGQPFCDDLFVDLIDCRDLSSKGQFKELFGFHVWWYFYIYFLELSIKGNIISLNFLIFHRQWKLQRDSQKWITSNRYLFTIRTLNLRPILSWHNINNEWIIPQFIIIPALFRNFIIFHSFTFYFLHTSFIFDYIKIFM